MSVDSKQSAAAPKATAKASDWFTIPAPLRRLFKHFPLLVYPANELPFRTLPNRELPTLYVFSTDQDALQGLPSFNPSCLKWQTFLKLAGAEFRIIPSTNHASPNGALPFLIRPSSASDADSQTPVPSNKLEKYARGNGSTQVPEVSSLRLEAYQSLLDHRIRNAWLYSLYLNPKDTALLFDLYINPTSSTQVVRNTIWHQLQHAAESEILKSTGAPAVNPPALYKGAEEAFEALATVLGGEAWFFGNLNPGLFDATVFAYTHLVLDEKLSWQDSRLRDALMNYPSLVEHRDRILARYWGLQG
ncbi:uncharacterized protein BCR38DRAFT_335148 [Pseudomassariella vexata]|uniref:Mitochondrial outer membrane protein n=1 Tax=Pseudomassariella vexata TaxID=1141098 RepID=A0A1Y2EB05_9PEZI|nr:uncharacterized protein BCR38DRAFT_335148 [Pseudomassariella vexata]ORY68749.1 hypothetical protein BCR38DRAFT_335148 [Pseudomassariella vexata]